MSATADLVLFGIEAALKLARTGRDIYVDDSQQRTVVLPLPPGFGADLPAKAKAYALGLSEANRPLFKRDFAQAIGQNDMDQVRDVYLVHIRRGLIQTDFRTAEAELAGLAAIRQWDKSPGASPLQRVGGALVEIAVDYYLHVPGAIREDSRGGKTLKAVLTSLDDFDFQNARFDSIVVALFTAGLEAISANPDLFTDEEDANGLVATIVTGIVTDVKTRLAGLSGPDALDAEDRLRQFSQIVLRGVLSGATRSVVDNPTTLGVDEAGKKALVKGVGNAFLDLLLDDDLPLADGLRRVASTGGLDKLMKAGLRAVAAHPGLFKTEKAVQKFIGDVVGGLLAVYPEDRSLFDGELVADLAYLVLENGRRNLGPLLLRKLPAEKTALLTHVVGEVLKVIVKPPTETASAAFKLDLSREDVLAVAKGTLDAIALHPEWVLDRPSNRKLAAALLPFTADVLVQVGKGGPFRELIREDRLQGVFAAVLTSGALADFAEQANAELAGQMATSVAKVLSKLAADGRAGLDLALGYDQVHDLLLALKGSGLLPKLLPNQQAGAKEVIDRIVTIVAAERRGEVLTVSAMKSRLTAG
jgi:hypothetical protein